MSEPNTPDPSFSDGDSKPKSFRRTPTIQIEHYDDEKKKAVNTFKIGLNELGSNETLLPKSGSDPVVPEAEAEKTWKARELSDKAILMAREKQ